MNLKMNEMSEIISKSKIKSQNESMCNTVHEGVKCQKCNQYPIIGYRYKCSVCNNYNLCQNCEENSEHEHDFIKIRKVNKNKTENEKKNENLPNKNEIKNSEKGEMPPNAYTELSLVI